MTEGHEGVVVVVGARVMSLFLFIFKRVRSLTLYFMFFFSSFFFVVLVVIVCSRYSEEECLIHTLHYVVLSLLIDTMEAHDFDLQVTYADGCRMKHIILARLKSFQRSGVTIVIIECL